MIQLQLQLNQQIDAQLINFRWKKSPLKYGLARLQNVRVVCKSTKRTILRDKQDDVIKKQRNGKKLNKREKAILASYPHVKVTSSVPFAKRITNGLRHARAPRTVKNILDEHEDFVDHITLSCAALTLSKTLYGNIASTTQAYDTLIDWTEQLFTSFDGKAISSVMLSLAKAVKVKELDKHCSRLRPLYERLLEESLNQITSLTFRDLGQILVSMVYIDWPDSRNAKIFIRACRTFQCQKSYQGDILRIFTAMNHYKLYNVRDIQLFLDGYGKYYQEDDCAGLMINLLQFQFYDKEVVQSIEKFVLMCKKWQPRQYVVCKLVKCFSNFGAQDREKLIDKLSALFKGDNHCAFPDELLEYMYGMTMLDCKYDLLEDIVTNIVNYRATTMFTQQELAWLREIQMVNKLSDNESLPYSPKLQAACENALLEQSQAKTLKLSSFKDEVFQIVFQEFQQQSQLDIIENGVLIDIGVNIDQYQGNKVAIVLIEKDQTMLNNSYMVLSEVKMRKRLYESLGWKVVEIFQRDWEKNQEYRGKLLEYIHHNIEN